MKMRFFGGSLDGQVLDVPDDRTTFVAATPVELEAGPLADGDQYKMTARMDTEIYRVHEFGFGATRRAIPFMVLADHPFPGTVISRWIESLIERELK